MESLNHELPREKWLEEVRALIASGKIYMRFLFRCGHILAIPSRLLVDGKKILLRRQLSGLSDSSPIELWIDLPDDLGATYEKKTNATGGVCLAITYKTEVGDHLEPFEKLYLSNQENLSDRASSESLVG